MRPDMNDDGLYDKAFAIVTPERTATTSKISRHLNIGFARAASLMERMEQNGVVSKPNHKGLREVLLLDQDAH